MLKHYFWQRIVLEVVLTLIVAIIIGAITEHFWLCMTLALLFLLACYIYQLQRLTHWIWRQNHVYPSSGFGALNILFYGLHKRQKRQRSKQQELANIIKRFRYGAESIPDALLLIEHSGAITWCNKIAQSELNIQWTHDKGQNIVNLIRYPNFANYMAKKEFSQPLTLLFKQQHYLEFRVIPYIDEQWIIIARDVGHLYLAEKQRRDFFTNASHELRTPITVVKGYLDMLADDMIPADDYPKTLHKMQYQISRMENLIGQILALSNIQNSPLNKTLQNVDVPTMLQNIEHDLKQLYPHYVINFTVDQTLAVQGIKSQFESVITNLIYNAIKHTPADTTIHVYWQRTQHGAYFEVSDNGPGIAAHHLYRLTERFYKVDDARNSAKKSSGLGLAIVKHALLNHGNTKLSITSELGKGSQFSFVLPVQYIIESHAKN